MIQKRFNELQPYLKGLKIADKFVIVEATLKDSWKVDNIIPEDVQVNQKEKSENGLKQCIMYTENRTLDELIDILEHVINTNVEIEQKQTLLRQKVDELKKMFEDKPLDELKSIKDWIVFYEKFDVLSEYFRHGLENKALIH